MFSSNELILIRHGVTQRTDRLCGRTDVALSADQPGVLAGLVQALSSIDQVITSPAQRCRQTADLIWGQGARPTDPRLWEQDFGDWENLAYADVPDIGDLDQAALAAHRPPNGESYSDVCARVTPALQEAAHQTGDKPLAIVAHAGVIRAALGLALGTPEKGLSFEIAHLSITRLRCLPDGAFSIVSANWLAT